MHRVTIHLKTITPLFLGGADPNLRAEPRTPAIKAALRFWYRAIDPAYNQPAWPDGPTWEAFIFGSADYGTGLFRLTVTGPKDGTWRWKDQRNRYKQAFTFHPGMPDVKNGLLYLGYSLDLGENDRKAIPAGQTITVVMRYRPPDDSKKNEKARKAIAAAWWLLGHVGGLGSRSRRGFGTVALQSWKVGGGTCPELSALPIAHTATTPEEWLKHFQQGLKQIKDWYPNSPAADHLVLGSHAKFYLIGPSADGGRGVGSAKVEAWELALNRAGRLMQDFRQRYGMGKGSDYDAVKAYLKKLHPSAPCTLAATSLTAPPERVAFGLPLTFRYGSMAYSLPGSKGKRQTITPNVTFQGTDHDRNASPLHIRIIRIGSKCYPFFARFDAPLLAVGEQVAVQRTPIGVGSQTVLDNFCHAVLDPVALKPVVTW